MMRNPITSILSSRNIFRLAITLTALSIASAVPMLSGAHAQATITVVNNSNWEIHHIYLSPVDNDDWGPDQLNDGIISPGGSFAVSVSGSESQVKVISEDSDGCFLYRTVDVTANAEWTITSDLVPSCGG